MDKQIIFDQDADQEGLLYDLDKANKEGLHESLTIKASSPQHPEPWDVPVSEALADAMVNEMEFAANLAPGETVVLKLDVIYRYDYGKPETT